jgi:C-terminal processing protease CtpA/Prc
VFEFAKLVADYVDGCWAGEDVAARALRVGRLVLAHETEFVTAREDAARAGARAAAAEAQLLELLSDAAGTTRLREELSEARDSNAAFAAAMGERYAALYEAHAAALAEENAALKGELASKGAELAELKEVLAQRQAAAGARADMHIGLDAAPPQPGIKQRAAAKREGGGGGGAA